MSEPTFMPYEELAEAVYTLGDHLHPWEQASVDRQEQYRIAIYEHVPVTAERHCLDNPDHRVIVKFTSQPDKFATVGKTLWMQCKDCAWWDGQLRGEDDES